MARGEACLACPRELVDNIGLALELDTDGIWCCLPATFPENYTLTTTHPKKAKYNISYPCVMLNEDVNKQFTNHQYQDWDAEKGEWVTRSECSIFFEVCAFGVADGFAVLVCQQMHLSITDPNITHQLIVFGTSLSMFYSTRMSVCLGSKRLPGEIQTQIRKRPTDFVQCHSMQSRPIGGPPPPRILWGVAGCPGGRAVPRHDPAGLPWPGAVYPANPPPQKRGLGKGQGKRNMVPVTWHPARLLGGGVAPILDLP